MAMIPGSILVFIARPSKAKDVLTPLSFSDMETGYVSERTVSTGGKWKCTYFRGETPHAAKWGSVCVPNVL
jgi:hypothetical protein